MSSIAAGTAAGPAAGPGASAALALDGVSVRYPGRREAALDVSLVVGLGEFVGVAGRTGAGKSTLALTAGGFVPRVVRARVGGSVVIDGVDALTARGPELAGRVGVVFSTPTNQLSASKITVREELAFGLENLAVPRSQMDPRIDEVLDRLGIAHLADRDPYTLSGGEQQRVAIASIVAMGTAVLVLDEPTAQLDPAGTAEVAALLRQLAAEGRAVVAAEHDPVVLASSARCLVLDAGRRAASGLPGEALGSTALTPLGLAAPTLVALAELAGVPVERAFDEAAVVAGLRRLRSPIALPPRPTQLDLAWQPMRNEPPATIAVRAARYRYPAGALALANVDLTVEPGQAVAIVGQNGSGKTTLAKHLIGLLRPEAGSVEIAGSDIRSVGVGTLARTVGFVFQNPDDQLFNRSVEREVGFGPRNLKLDAKLASGLVEQALELAGLSGVREVNPYDLGLSIRKLVALASVLAMEPSVLVLDEPTTGQDGPGVARVGAIVEAYRRAGRTVVAVTHDMEFAAEHFDRVVVMRRGEVVADASPSEVFASEDAARLASTGLVPPVAARVGAGLGLGRTPTLASLVARLGGGLREPD
jgi:energy-coupling factor transport system ATP-binding protein